MQKRTIQFFFDYISPNAYLAWTQLPKLMAKHDLTVELIPVLFTGLLRAHGQMGPAEIPAKRDWMSRNIARKAALLDVPLAPPKHHPYNPLLSLRLSSLKLREDQRWQLIDSFMRGIWEQSLHPSQVDDVAKIITAAGLDADDLLAKVQSPDIAARLKQQTDLAVKQGVFGIPTVVSDGEIFFGYDDFEYLEMVLQGNDPLAQSDRARTWIGTALTPSSVRKEIKNN